MLAIFDAWSNLRYAIWRYANRHTRGSGTCLLRHLSALTNLEHDDCCSGLRTAPQRNSDQPRLLFVGPTDCAWSHSQTDGRDARKGELSTLPCERESLASCGAFSFPQIIEYASGADLKMISMNGQWLGTFNGFAGDGSIVVNIDECDTHYQGVAYT